MTDRELIEKVAQMRDAQKEYFALHRTEDLRNAKRLEREVDAEIKRRDDKQPELFGD